MTPGTLCHDIRTGRIGIFSCYTRSSRNMLASVKWKDSGKFSKVLAKYVRKKHTHKPREAKVSVLTAAQQQHAANLRLTETQYLDALAPCGTCDKECGR